ncbi:hypothetical protein G6F66_015274 [Rhizopus arrhizus]|nr:hypothetical protein G6F66_015274 [Rhizopus arrhizus]
MGADPALPQGPVLDAAARRRVRWSKTFAVVTPLAFLAVIAVMVVPRLFPSVPALHAGRVPRARDGRLRLRLQGHGFGAADRRLLLRGRQ